MSELWSDVFRGFTCTSHRTVLITWSIGNAQIVPLHHVYRRGVKYVPKYLWNTAENIELFKSQITITGHDPRSDRMHICISLNAVCWFWASPDRIAGKGWTSKICFHRQQIWLIGYGKPSCIQTSEISETTSVSANHHWESYLLSRDTISLYQREMMPARSDGGSSTIPMSRGLLMRISSRWGRISWLV